MIKTTKILLTALITVFALASCMKTDEGSVSSECAILSFSVKDITSYVPTKNAAGKDTVISKTIGGSSIFFNIDQVNGIITTTDSLVNWVNLEKVVANFTSNGIVFRKAPNKDEYYQWTSGSDSVNFENPVEIYVYGTDRVSFKRYTASIKRSAYMNDTIIWSDRTNDFKVTTDFKTIDTDNHVYAFFRNEEGKVQITSSSITSSLASWTTPQNIEGADIDYTSVLIFKGDFYGLGTDGCIYRIERNATAYSAEKVCEKAFTQLLASDKYFIYTSDGKEILASKDFETWTSSGSTDIDMLPTSSRNSFCYTSKTNDDILISMMNGVSANNEKYAVTWYKITSDYEDVNQKWMYIQITDDNKYGMQKFNCISTTLYKESIFAMGMNPDENGGTTSKYIYKSDDNGITWHNNMKYPLPSDLNPANGTASLIAADGKLWIIQKGGKIWSGVIR